MSELPGSWVQVGFDDAVSVVSDRGQRIKQKDYLPKGVLPVIDQGEGLIGGYTSNLEAKVESSGPVIVFGDHTRRFKFATFPFAVGADGVKLFSANQLWNPEFLFLQLAAVNLEDRGYGRHYQHLRKVWLALPPLNEQTRIVAKLEELLSDLDAGVAELKAAQKKLQQYRQSLLMAAVEGRDGVSYQCHSLGTLVKEIGQGWSPKCDNEPASNEAQWAVIKTTAIQPLSFDDAHNKRLPPTLKPRPHLELRVGDLLVTRAGPRSRVGITCLVRQTRMKLMLCDKAYRIRCDESQINPSFLELVLNAPHFVQQIDALKTGINDSGLNLTQDRFFTLMIPVPELQEQERLVEQICTLNTAIQEQEKNIEQSLKQSTAQRQNILRAAFAGQLVPQEPNDEPASVLLERIRSERAAQAATKKPRGRKTEEAAA